MPTITSTKLPLAVFLILATSSCSTLDPPYDSEYAKILQITARKTDLFFTKWLSNNSYPYTTKGRDLYDEISVDVRSLNWRIRISTSRVREKEISILNDSWQHVGKLINFDSEFGSEEDDNPTSVVVIKNLKKIINTQLEIIAKKEEEIRITEEEKEKFNGLLFGLAGALGGVLFGK